MRCECTRHATQMAACHTMRTSCYTRITHPSIHPPTHQAYPSHEPPTIAWVLLPPPEQKMTKKKKKHKQSKAALRRHRHHQRLLEDGGGGGGGAVGVLRSQLQTRWDAYRRENSNSNSTGGGGGGGVVFEFAECVRSYITQMEEEL